MKGVRFSVNFLHSSRVELTAIGIGRRSRWAKEVAARPIGLAQNGVTERRCKLASRRNSKGREADGFEETQDDPRTGAPPRRAPVEPELAEPLRADLSPVN